MYTKQFITITILTGLFFLFVPGGAQAFSSSAGSEVTLGVTEGETVVTGQIISAGGGGVPSATVHVECNGNNLSTTSGPTGYYIVKYTMTQCAPGDTVTVVASKGSDVGSNARSVSPTGNAFLTVAIIDVQFAIPEFGIIPGAVALLSSIGSIAFIRRKRS